MRRLAPGLALGLLLGAAAFDSSGKLRAKWKISTGGKYTLRGYEVANGVGVTEVHKEITVVLPPAASTKDCTH